MGTNKTSFPGIFFITLWVYLGAVVEPLAWGQLRTPEGGFFQLAGLSPLNDTHYFKALVNRYSKKTVTLPLVAHKFKKIPVFGTHIMIRPVVTGQKILAPQHSTIQDPYVSELNRSIPGGLAPSQNESEVFKRFGDQAIQNWLNSPEVRNSSFGKVANKVEGAMKVEASIQSAPVSPGALPTDHKFSFQYLALQSLTKVEYKGWTNAQFRMDSSKSETALEISEKVFKNKEFVISHIKNPIEINSSMGLRWSW